MCCLSMEFGTEKLMSYKADDCSYMDVPPMPYFIIITVRSCVYLNKRQRLYKAKSFLMIGPFPRHNIQVDSLS